MNHSIPALATSHLSYIYPNGQQALDDVSLNIPSGSFSALIAANGSGKTTLLKTLTGLIKPNAGRVFIRNQALDQIAKTELYQTIGLVFQNPTDQLFCATVMDDVAYGPRNLGLSESIVQERVHEALDAVGALSYAHRPIHQLSYGEQKRVTIAGVLALRPPIMILDEPTAGLDPAGEWAMLSLLRSLNEQGTTMLISTHAIDLLPEFADSLSVLHHGKIIATGTPSLVLQDKKLMEMASLRLPYLTHLFHDFQHTHSLKLEPLPVTRLQATQALTRLLDHSSQPPIP